MTIAATDIKRRALGKGLDSLLPRVPRRPRFLCRRERRGQAAGDSPRADRSQPLPDALADERGAAGRAGRVDHRERSGAAGAGAPAGQRPLSADRRRAALAGLGAGRQEDDSGDSAPGLRRAGDGDHHRREPAARRPEPDGAGARLRAALARVPHDPGADGGAHRQGPRNCG